MVNLKIGPSIYSLGSPLPPRVLQPVCSYISGIYVYIFIYRHTYAHTHLCRGDPPTCPGAGTWGMDPEGVRDPGSNLGAFSLPAFVVKCPARGWVASCHCFPYKLLLIKYLLLVET